MLYNKIVNPETGRLVNINGRLGRRVLKTYLTILTGGGSVCTKYHNNPVKCQSSRDESGEYCVYTAGRVKGEVVSRKSGKDKEAAKERARRRRTQEEKFQHQQLRRFRDDEERSVWINLWIQPIMRYSQIGKKRG